MKLTRKKLRRLIQEQLVKEGFLDSLGGFFGFGGGGNHKIKFPLGTLKSNFIKNEYIAPLGQALVHLINSNKLEFRAAVGASESGRSTLYLPDFQAQLGPMGSSVELVMNDEQAKELITNNRWIRQKLETITQEEINSAARSLSSLNRFVQYAPVPDLGSVLWRMKTGHAADPAAGIDELESLGANINGFKVWENIASGKTKTETGVVQTPLPLSSGTDSDIQSFRNSTRRIRPQIPVSLVKLIESKSHLIVPDSLLGKY